MPSMDGVTIGGEIAAMRCMEKPFIHVIHEWNATYASPTVQPCRAGTDVPKDASWR